MFTDLVHDPVFAIFGVPAVLVTAAGLRAEVTVIDKSRGGRVPGQTVEMATLLPLAELREAELLGLGIARGDLHDGRLTIGAGVWRIDDVLEHPSMFGAGDGKLSLMLLEDGR